MNLAKRKYVAYLSRDYAPGTRYVRRKKFLEWIVRLSKVMHEHIMETIWPKKYSDDGTKPGYLEKIWKKWKTKTDKFISKATRKIYCRTKAERAMKKLISEARSLKASLEATKASEKSKTKFLKYLVEVSKNVRAKLAYFAKTCKAPKDSRPYVTKMYKRWKRMSGKFVRKNKRRLCKDKYKDKLDKYWSKQKKRAERQYQAHLKAAVAWLNSRKKAIKGAETSVSDDESEVGEAELAGPDDTRFIGYLKRETRKTEKKVREYLRRCGFTIIPRGSKKLKKKLKKIRKKYARKMKKVTRTPPPEAQIAKDKTYGITLGLANGGNPNNIGIGVEDLKKDKNGNTAGFTPWKFNKDKDFKRNSYDVGISFGRRRRRT